MSDEVSGGLGDPALVTSQEWRAMSELESDIVLVVDPDGVCESATLNAAYAVGRPVRDLVVEDDLAAVEAMVAGETGGPVWLRLPTRDNDVQWMHGVGVPRSHRPGRILQLRRPRQVDVSERGPGGHGLDAVTGVAGRERALDEVAFLLSATPRTGKEIAVACCGLDNFSALNASLGEAAGDEVLRIVAGRICDALRSGDLVARLDGDRLLIVLRGVHHLRGAIRVANKVRAVIEDPIALASGEVEQTASIGVTLISRGESVDSVLDRAIGAMLLAKQSGRNTVVSSPPI